MQAMKIFFPLQIYLQDFNPFKMKYSVLCNSHRFYEIDLQCAGLSEL